MRDKLRLFFLYELNDLISPWKDLIKAERKYFIEIALLAY